MITLLTDTYYLLRLPEFFEKLEKKIISRGYSPRNIELVITESQLMKIEQVFIVNIRKILERVNQRLQMSREKIKITELIKILKDEALTIFLIALHIYLGVSADEILRIISKDKKKSRKKISRQDLKTLAGNLQRNLGEVLYKKESDRIGSTRLRAKIRRFLEDLLKRKEIILSVRRVDVRDEEVKKLSSKFWKERCKKECNKRPDSEDIKLALQFSRIMVQSKKIEILIQEREKECLTCIITYCKTF
ncbi:MAG: hypothetical protein DRO40_13020 [Thermoprotei archaeon]|nr:MAG: hypothetical protein DRO40_13020 [Thermoprotei archaeon]